MQVTIGQFKIDYKDGGAVLYKNNSMVKCFASDETKNGSSGYEKALHYIGK